ncbi:MAG: response regulator [Acidobacteria bacterium]|nr:MAG: response regulator [Acidobacteriota bacterium]
MKVLIVDDDPVSRRVLEAFLARWGYEVWQAENGTAALEKLAANDAPRLAILDWMMPGLDGVEVCRRLRAAQPPLPIYLIVLTAKGNSEDIVEGLGAGADDYVTKPFHREVLRARVQVGERVLALQTKLRERVEELEAALAKIRTLQGLLPICSYCKRIRDDRNYWQQVEEYFGEHSGAEFSHGICPECYAKHVAPELNKAADKKA